MGNSIGNRVLPFTVVLSAWIARAAAADQPFAAPQTAIAAGTGGGVLRTMLALLLVLAAVLATAWFARRLRTLSGGAAGDLCVLGQLPLGARERAVLIRVEGERLLLGVAPGNVRMLHVLAGADRDTPAPPSASPGAETNSGGRPSFRSILLRSLGK